MARTELPNGVILPAEYSDDWYEDMTSNLTKLDDVIGSDSEKLNSNDVAFLRMSSAALTDGGTGNFSDLNSSNKLKTGDYVLDSGRKLYQVVSVDSTNETFTVGNSLFKITAESDLAPVAESGDYDDLDNKPDLNPYDQHIVNTDIHVTTADKTKWNNGVTQSYVFRYSGTAVVPNSTIAYSTIDNTDNIKSGDKILDVDGKMFEITAVDTTNQTVTVGTALVDLALDANVVHTNRNDDVSIPLNSTSAELGVTGGSTNVTFLDKNDKKLSGLTLGNYESSKLSYARLNIFDKDTNNNEIQDTLEYAYVSNNNNAYLRVSRDNFCALGTTSYRWKGVYAQSYYYGSDNVEFSTKFVTSDTAQTVTGSKTFSSNTLIYNSDNTANTPNLILQSSKIQLGDTTNSDTQSIVFNAGNSFVSKVESFKDTAGTQNLQNTVRTKDASNNVISAMYRLRLFNSGFASLESSYDNTISLGRNNLKWKDVQTYLVNGLTPSSLSMPSDRSARVDISGYFTNTANGDTNTYTVPANGWIYLNLSDVVEAHCFAQTAGNLSHYGQTFARASAGQLHCLFPVRKDDVFVSQWYTTTTVTVTNAYFIPCQGNV